MPASIQWEVKLNRFPEVKQRFRPAVATIVAKTTMDIYAKSQITAPVRRPDVEARTKTTGGALKNSGQVNVLAGQLEGEISYTMYYAGYVHEGTYKMAARPWLRETVESSQSTFIAAFMQLESML